MILRSGHELPASTEEFSDLSVLGTTLGSLAVEAQITELSVAQATAGLELAGDKDKGQHYFI